MALTQSLPPPTLTLADGRLELVKPTLNVLIQAMTSNVQGLNKMLTAAELATLANEMLICSEMKEKRLSLIVGFDGSHAGYSTIHGLCLNAQCGDNIKLAWSLVHATVSYVQPTTAVQREVRGRRRYGIAGPRDAKRWIEYIPRGLTTAEINFVKLHLERAVHAQLLGVK